MPIVDEDVARQAGWTAVDVAEACLAGGATLLQVRAKQASSAAFLDLASAVVAAAHERGARVIINDRADVARLSGADGVHVGQDDLSPLAVRTIVGPGALVGFSTHTLEQIEAALRLVESGPGSVLDYLAIGPVFGTATKDTGYGPRGVEMVAAAAELTARVPLPLVAIGGMTLERVDAVIAAGAAGVAVISDLLLGGDPQAQVRSYLRRLTV